MALYGFWIQNKQGVTDYGMVTGEDREAALSKVEETIDAALETVEIVEAETLIEDQFEGLAFLSDDRITPTGESVLIEVTSSEDEDTGIELEIED